MKIEIKKIIDANIIRITTPDERWYQLPNTDIWLPSSTWICDYAPKGIEFYKWLASKGWDEAESIKVSAGNKGSIVHNATEILAKTGEIKIDDTFQDSNGDFREMNADEYEGVMSFYNFCNDYDVEFLDHEKTVFNKEIGYAGTLDHRVKLKTAEGIYIIDKKTSANIYLSHEIQLSSYFHADDIEADKMAILQLGYKRNKKGYKFTEVEDKFNLFVSAYSFWEADNKGKQPKQKDYPTTLTLHKGAF